MRDDKDHDSKYRFLCGFGALHGRLTIVTQREMGNSCCDRAGQSIAAGLRCHGDARACERTRRPCSSELAAS